MEDSRHSLTNGRYNPSWFRLFRQVVIFLLGIGILLYAVVSQGHDIPFLVTGLILIGIVPIEDAISRLASRPKRSHPSDE